MLRAVTITDAKQIKDIYNYYIEFTDITFEEEKLTTCDMEKRITDVTALYPWIVYEENGEVVGYAYATRWKGRKAYDFSVESSVYIKHSTGGRGVGTKLYEELIKELKTLKVHAVIGGVALPNEPSTRLHEKLGFNKVAQFPEVGYKFGKWIDVGYWQLNI